MIEGPYLLRTSVIAVSILLCQSIIYLMFLSSDPITQYIRVHYLVIGTSLFFLILVMSAVNYRNDRLFRNALTILAMILYMPLLIAAAYGQ